MHTFGDQPDKPWLYSYTTKPTMLGVYDPALCVSKFKFLANADELLTQEGLNLFVFMECTVYVVLLNSRLLG